MDDRLDALAAISRRHSTRSFVDKTVPREVLELLIDAARRAPSANNVQPWHFVVVTARETRARIAALTDWGRFIAHAPVCVAVFCEDTAYYLEDGCAATQNLLVAAASLGVDSCWVAGDKKDYARKVGELLGVPGGFKLVSLVPLGYASRPHTSSSKKALESVLHWEKFAPGPTSST